MKRVGVVVLLLLVLGVNTTYAQGTPRWVELHRYYHKTINDHLYVTTPAQREDADTRGYDYENPQCFVSDQPFDGGVPVIRWWNNTIGDHFYTTNPNERPTGYVKDSDNVFYVATKQYADSQKSGGNLVPFYRFWMDAPNGDHFYTSNEVEANNIRNNAAYEEEPILGYVSPSPPVNIIITSEPAGRQITIDGTLTTAPKEFIHWTTGAHHELSVSTQQSGGDGVQYLFSRWNDGGGQTRTIEVPTTQTTYTAQFTTQFLLTTSVHPLDAGFVTPSPSGPWYNSGTQVTLTPSPATGFLFLGWGGHIPDASGALIMNGPKSVTARFDLLNHSPVLEPISDRTVQEGTTLVIQLSASDPDNDTLVYSVAGNPLGSNLSGNIFTWTPDFGIAGRYSGITFAAEDGKGGQDSETIAITVEGVPQTSLDLFARISSQGPIQFGESFDIELLIQDATDVLGIACILHYPEQLLQIAETPILGTFLGSDVIYHTDYSSLPGAVQFAVTKKQGQGGVTGSGTVVTVRFIIVGTGGESIPLTFSEVTSYGANRAPIFANLHEGMLYRLEINSAHGSPQGAGWYPEGVNATWSVESPSYEDGDVRYVTNRLSGTIPMNGAHTETIPWSAQYYLTGLLPNYSLVQRQEDYVSSD